MTDLREYIVKHVKVVIPIVVIALVAVMVPVLMGAGNAREEDKESGAELETLSGVVGLTVEPLTAAREDAPLTPNENGTIYTLVATYYNAMGTGDTETLKTVFDEVSENDLLRYEKTSGYLDRYSDIQIYTKPGVEEGTLLTYVYYKVIFLNHEQEVPGYQTLYVCEDGQGGYYIKNEKNFTTEEEEYIKKVNAQDDVVQFNNRVNQEYNELMVAHPELLKYLGELGRQVNAAIGVALAEQNSDGTEGGEQNPAVSPEGGETPEQPAEGQDVAPEQPAEGQEGTSEQPTEGQEGTPEQPAEGQDVAPEQPAEGQDVQPAPAFATATTTVNVRSSDSEQADKLGKVEKGTRLQVQEVGANGWTKVFFEGRDGYIKSDYLKAEESVDSLAVIGTVTAIQNINIRAAAAEDAERLGLLAGGESLDLLAIEGDWCKVKYNGQAAYVKADYVTQQ